MKTASQKLFQKDFTLVVIGQIISLFGNAILRFALPLHLLRETGSSALFGIVTACSFLPMIVLSLLGGVLADRVNKRNVMVILDFSTVGLIATFSLCLGKLPMVPLFAGVLMLLYGISGTYQPAVQASIPLLVPKEKLMAGNAVINQVSTLAGLLGPVVGGILFGLWGVEVILWVSMVCFFLSAVMELFIHIPHHPQKAQVGVVAMVKGDLGESLTFVRREKPALFSVVWILAAFNLVISALMIVGIPILVVGALGQSDTALGYTQGAMALGGLAGGILVAVFGKVLTLERAHWLLGLCGGAVGVMGGILLLGASSGVSYWVITGMGAIAMACATIFSVEMFTLIQQVTPPHLVGKVMASIIAVAMCSQPLGQALYGVLFEVFATQPGWILLGAAVLSLPIALRSKMAFAALMG